MIHNLPNRRLRIFALPLIVFALLVATTTNALLANDSPDSDEGWISLFNGEDLTGWKVTEDNPETFQVVDGVLVVKGPRAHLYYAGEIADADFKDFEWKCEILTKPNANSGMYFHTKYQKEGWPEKGYEVQVNNTHGDRKKTGGLYSIADVMDKSPAKDNKWFTQHVIVRGKRVIIKVNGKVTTDYTEPNDPKREEALQGRVLSSGTLAIQGHDPGSEIHYRNIMVKPLDAEEAATGDWTVLFDGSSLDAWRGYGAPNKPAPSGWEIEGDALTRTADVGDLITREKYESFELSFDWKISKGGNSGVMYRVQETDKPSYFTGPEYQVFDHAGHKMKPTALTAAGALYDLYSPSEDASRPAGEWNEGRIVIDGNHLEHWLNGKKVVDATFGSDDWNRRVKASKFATRTGFGQHPKGHIALQDHGNQVWYRNIKIRPLAGKKTSRLDVPTRILLVSQSAGFKHSTVNRKASDLSHTERVMKELGVRSGAFRIDCTQDVETDFTPELLANYNIVMFYTTGNLPIPEKTLDWFLGTWLKEKGHGFLGVHSAADTYHEYEPFWDMIGGTFSGHPWNLETTVTIKVHDPSHPAAAPWGEEVTIKDEIYQFKHWQPEKVRVLMSLDMEKTELKKPYHVPILWVKEYGEGRVMHMSLGHREDVWENPTYQASLLGGIRWLTGEVDSDATPNPEVSAAEDAKARKAAGK